MISTTLTSRPGEYVAILALCLTMVSCSSDDGSGAGGNGGDAGRRGEVLAALGENVVVPLQIRFASDAAALEVALAAASADPGGSDAAQAAWRQAMVTWQELEMMQFGPSGSSLTVMGGSDLRARIYSWPILNLCLVDQQTVQDGYDDPDVLEGTPGTPIGLGAIEYLVFTDSLENNCLPDSPINQEGTWDDMIDMVPQRRLDYATSLATLVRRRADELVAAWSPDGGNYIAEFTNPGRSGAVYGSAQEGLNAVSDAMFYLDKETKDMKLGEPLGITDCDASQCPEAIESPWAEASKENVLANLIGFQILFLGAEPGTDALGFDDLLVDMGASDVAADMAQATEAAISATEAVPGSFVEALEQDPASMEAAHSAIQVLTDLLKTDFVSVLELELPDRAAGDND